MSFDRHMKPPIPVRLHSGSSRPRFMNIAWYICCVRSEVEANILDVEAWCQSLIASRAEPGRAFIEVTNSLHALEYQSFDVLRADINAALKPDDYIDSLRAIATRAISDRRLALGPITRTTATSAGRFVGWTLFQSDWSHLALESSVVCEADCPFPDFWIACTRSSETLRIISWFPAAYVPAITHALELMPTQAAWWVNDDFEFLPPFES
ncbi:MAG: hypothetical protein ACK5VN_04865 [Phycisphaerae bacterium]